MTETEGYIYIMFNDVFNYYGNNVFKIGKTTDIQQRVNAYVTSYIQPCEVKYVSETCINYSLAEAIIFQKIDKYRVVKNREFFKVDKQEAIEIIEDTIKKINDRTIIEKPRAIKENKHDCKTVKKIELIREVEREYDLDITDPEFNNKHGEISFSDGLFERCIKLFRSKKVKPMTHYELRQLYTVLIKQVYGMNSILSKQIRQRKDRNKYYYYLNPEIHKSLAYNDKFRIL